MADIKYPTKYFLGTNLVNPKVYYAKIKELIDKVNGLVNGTVLRVQVAQAAKTTATTLTAAEIIAGLLTANQGGAAAANYTLPLATSVDAALIGSAANDSFEFSLINISTVAAEDITIITNTGWTLVGEMTVESNDSDRAASSGRFLCRKTATGAWTIYRIA